ncbi:prepilin peptidase [Serratia fonticola]
MSGSVPPVLEWTLSLMGGVLLITGLVVLATGIMRPACRFLQHHAGQTPTPSARLGWAWLYGVLGGLLLLLSASWYSGFTGLVMLGFLLQLSVMDSEQGWLPREFTVRSGLAGVLVSLERAEDISSVLWLMVSIGAPVLLFGGMRWLSMRRTGVESLGLGDVYLVGALGAWLGLSMTLDTLLLGVYGFTFSQLWPRVQRFPVDEGAPLGPWLCGGAVVVTLLERYAPVLLWAV